MVDKIKNFKALLEQSGIPFRYYEWKTKPKAFPFGAYVFMNRTSLRADGGNYYSTDRMRVEIYFDKKDIAVEEAFEGILDEDDIIYDKSEEYLTDEKMIEIIYEMEI